MRRSGSSPTRATNSRRSRSAAGPTLFPTARLPLEQEVGQILPSDAILAVTRHGDVSVTLEAGPNATLAFLYDIPQGAHAGSLKLPDGRLLALQ
ncbi:MAG TPA: hypothetical protein VKH42_07100 [Vicinamibacterales bacterium]|nr:hypothetical protein [Vicinamibacterales bacterium]